MLLVTPSKFFLLFQQLLCTYAFPKCTLRGAHQVPLPLCREDCLAVSKLFCYNDWALVEDNKLTFESRGHFHLPDCDALPSHIPVNHNGSSNVSSPPYQPEGSVCSPANLTEMKYDQITRDCVKGRGRFYQGNVNVTKDGLPCQKWDEQEPHEHDRPPDVFPEVQNAENYCRNAGGEEHAPWCYTMDPAIRWQHCDIPLCGMLNFKKEITIKFIFIELFLLIHIFFFPQEMPQMQDYRMWKFGI